MPVSGGGPLGVLVDSDDGFATWCVSDLTLLGGTDVLEVAFKNADGNTGISSLTIEKAENPGVALRGPGSMAFDPNNANQRLLVSDLVLDALLAVDLSESPGIGRRSINKCARIMNFR